MGRGIWLLAALGWMSVSAASGRATAQDAPLEAARELYAEARVEAAAEVLREGLQAGAIGEGRVLEALELLALVERARADEAALEEALRWLMLADREGEALRSSPPSLRARYDALWEAEGAALPEVEAEGGAAGWTLRAEGAPLPGVALVLRGETDEGWEEGPSPLQLPAAPRLRYGFVLRLGQTDLYRSALARAEAA
ncbi:MAG TPA: hypothetical protein RMG95_17055, partial [Polyangiaceae bacterium LLY-WYZ-15_(1-7)]|nr:hypothetical protein [Polyangiaceae bacterium LLY-WYZ-15_(1-7)]